MASLNNFLSDGCGSSRRGQPLSTASESRSSPSTVTCWESVTPFGERRSSASCGHAWVVASEWTGSEAVFESSSSGTPSRFRPAASELFAVAEHEAERDDQQRADERLHTSDELCPEWQQRRLSGWRSRECDHAVQEWILNWGDSVGRSSRLRRSDRRRGHEWRRPSRTSGGDCPRHRPP